MKLAVITTHPIQYYAPIFQLLNQRNQIEVKVFYTWEKGAAVFDEGFGKSFDWDIPLLEGYNFQFVSNEGRTKKSFWAIRNPSLIQEVEEWGADIILVYGWNFYSHLKAMRYFKGKKTVIFRGDSTLLKPSGKVKKVARRIFLRWVYRHIDYALYVGTNNKEYYLKYGLNNNQLIFAPHAIDNRRFRNYPNIGTDNIQGNPSLPQGVIRILYVGKFQPTKDPGLLVDAVQQLNRSDVHLLMVGNGELEEMLRQKAANNPRIHFLPFQNQSVMPSVYQLGDIFCLPSKGETWGLTVNEAMAAGKAILVSDRVGCAPDLVREGQNGYIFKSGDVLDLQEKIKLLASADLSQMGKTSSDIINSWNFTRIVEEIESLNKIQPAKLNI